MKISKIFLSIVIGFLIHFLYLMYLNEYPLIWSDSRAYIKYALLSENHTFGSTFYPLYISITSLKVTLWFTIFANYIICSYCLYRFIDFFVKEKKLICFILLNLLFCFSSYSYFINSVMPDIFLGIGFLLNYMILLKSIDRRDVFIYIIFCFCVIAHNGFFYIFLLINLSVLFIKLIFSKNVPYISKNIWFTIMLVLLSGIFLKPLIGKLYKEDFRSKREVVFFCRQFEILRYDKLLDELLLIGCTDNMETNLCFLNTQKKSYSKHLRKPKYENDCKSVFIKSIKNTEFRRVFLNVKMNNVFKMWNWLHRLNNPVGARITSYKQVAQNFKNEPFLKIENCNLMQNRPYYFNQIGILQSVNWWIIKLSQCGVLVILFLGLYKWMMRKQQEELVLLIIHLLLSLIISLIFYSVFSRFSQIRYTIRVSWVFHLLLYFMIFNTYNKIINYYKLKNKTIQDE